MATSSCALAKPGVEVEDPGAKDVSDIVSLQSLYLYREGWDARQHRGTLAWLDSRTGRLYSHQAALQEQQRRTPEAWDQALRPPPLEVEPDETPLENEKAARSLQVREYATYYDPAQAT